MKSIDISSSLSDLEQHDAFISRHVGPNPHEVEHMLTALGVNTLDELIAQTVPADIRLNTALELDAPISEENALAKLKSMAQKNVLKKSMIGMGYYDTFTPTVILRNVLENPGWYTAYTPYQAEIAQGRLEALLNYQQMVCDLTGMSIANASLLDEATAAAEAMAMARRIAKTKANAFFVSSDCFPQTIDVLKTRAKYFGFELIIGSVEEASQRELFGALLQYPNTHGEIGSYEDAITQLKAKGAVVAVASDLLALMLLRSPGSLGADICLGSSQRFGVPLGFGGPHAAFFATTQAHARAMPGRIIGVSKDVRGKNALRMALQTREQHIRREKANSNICTSQVLLANIAGMYAVYHGPEGLRAIATRVHRLAAIFASGLKAAGMQIATRYFFDSLDIALDAKYCADVHARALAAGYNLRHVSAEVLGISFDETSSREDVEKLWALFGVQADVVQLDARLAQNDPWLPQSALRSDDVLTHAVFNTHHSEHEMLRYLKKLQNKDLALDHSMISLGSCTMKLNATSEMLPISWPEFAKVHPFAPRDQTVGYLEMIASLEHYLKRITGFDAICMQPNSGAQGEYMGLVAIRRYHASRGEAQRTVCLIPKSAHGTNPATAQMCGMEVVVVACDERGNVDLADLRAKAEAHAAHLGALMVTYPSTHGVFETAIKEICAIVHHYGGQVYMDGANLNAQVGLTSPAAIGADVSHMNLHKTFCIPHGGGGPGMGPIGLRAHLAPFIADHVVTGADTSNAHDYPHHGQGAVSAAPFGSASILPISWMYITMMGGTGLSYATQIAILNANYIATRLKDHYPVLYTGAQGRVAHECILDIRPIKAESGITEADIAKRLMDYGFHAPTMSFPVPGTLMVEPTESEALIELDRFVEAMIAIREEIRQVQNGVWPKDNNPLVNAPHTQGDILTAQWDRPYAREVAVTPLSWVAENKFWPSVNRIDDVYGDRNLFCSCIN